MMISYLRSLVVYFLKFWGSERNLQAYYRDIALTIPKSFLVIYENDKPAFEYPDIIKFCMENQIKVEYKTPFKGFSGKYDKYDKQYLYI